MKPFPTLLLIPVFALRVGVVMPLESASGGDDEGRGDGRAKSAFLTAAGVKGITSLRRAGDLQGTEFIDPGGKALGEIVVRYRSEGEAWQNAATSMLTGASGGTADDGLVVFRVTGVFGGELEINERFRLQGDALVWSIRLRNRGKRKLTLGDLALLLPMHTSYPRVSGRTEVKRDTFTRRVFRHAFVSGHGSFLFWLPVGGEGAHLVMTPLKGTKLEFFEEPQSDYAHGGTEYRAYVHSAARAETDAKGSWRQPHTSLELEPAEEASYGFAFRWADDYRTLREVLYRNEGFDIHVVPGMVVPRDLFALFALRTRNELEAVVAEFPQQTTVEYVGETRPDTHVYKVGFRRLGENALTVKYDGGRSMLLEFFVTQPLETLFKKRAAFIAARQQHRDPSKWYNGLFSLWDVRMPEGKNLLGPENLGGQHPYAVSGSDDPSTGKCVFLSEKNVAYPEPREIDALEYFVEHFVWGKHQRTDKERPYPYGIYGCDSWHQNRFTERDPHEKKISRPGGPSACRMWRTFDYPHYIVLYYNLYRIARQNPGLVSYLDADGYLERSYGTARAFFEVPYGIRMEGGWSFTGWTDWAYKIGNFHEKYLLPLITALEREGRQGQADWLRGEWEKKVKYFLYDDPYPFISEMPVDSTAYESTYAIARYSLHRDLKPDNKLWQDKEDGRWYSHPVIERRQHEDFLRRQLLANLACRGWLETSYYYLGSDFRGCGSSFYALSYMSQMGGWSVLDQALQFEEEPAELLRLGYAALLSSWALMNAGDVASNHGYWTAGSLHDGAVGWGFMPQRFGHDWNPATKGIPRGAWPVDGEIDHGLTAAVEAAATIVVDDPLFGLFAYGGTLEDHGASIDVTPRDGTRQKLYVLRGKKRLRLLLDRDGFASRPPLKIGTDMASLRFALENRGTGAHSTRLAVRGLPPGTYRVSIADRAPRSVVVRVGSPTVLRLPVDVGEKSVTVSIVRAAR